MKKIIFAVYLVLFSAFLPRNSYAAWPDFTPLIPFSPQFCPMCVAPAVSNAISYYERGVALKDDLEKYTDMTVVKQMATSYVSKMGVTTFNRLTQDKHKKKRVISHARTIENSTVADVTDEVSVREAFKKLFLQYPSRKAQTKQAYEIMGRQLKMDTTLEMYITAVEMEKELYGSVTEGETIKSLENVGMLKQIDLIESCLVKGENCEIVGLKSCQEKIGSGDDDTREDQVCFWNSALQAERLYDSIMRDNLFLAAMHAQYKAVMGINQMAKIKEFEEETDASITNNISNIVNNETEGARLRPDYVNDPENDEREYWETVDRFATMSPDEFIAEIQKCPKNINGQRTGEYAEILSDLASKVLKDMPCNQVLGMGLNVACDGTQWAAPFDAEQQEKLSNMSNQELLEQIRKCAGNSGYTCGEILFNIKLMAPTRFKDMPCSQIQGMGLDVSCDGDKWVEEWRRR